MIDAHLRGFGPVAALLVIFTLAALALACEVRCR
jgi:hypothetical protein